MLNFLLRPVDSMTSPNCPSGSFEIIQIMCSEMPCSSKLFQSAGQWTRSNAFDKSKPAPEYQHPRPCPGIHLRSKDDFQFVCHDESRVAPRAGGHQTDVRFCPRQGIEYFVKQTDVSYGPKPATSFGRIFLGNMLNKVQNHNRGTAP